MPSADLESNEPAPRRPRQDPPAPPPAPAAAPGVADLLLLARALLREGGEGPPSAPAAGTKPGQLVTPGQARGPLPKEQKKFYKLANPPAPVPAPAPGPEPAGTFVAPEALTNPPAALPLEEREEAEDGEEEPGLPAPADTPAGERAPARPLRGPSPVEERTGGRRRSVSRRQRVLMISMGVSSAVGSFFVGLLLGWTARPAAPKNPGPAAVAGQTPAVASTLAARALAPDAGLRRALATIDEAEAAHGAGDWPRMETLLEQGGREAGPSGMPGLTFHQAEIAVRRGDLNAANAFAQRALESGEDVAKAYALRAVIAQRSGRPEVALPLLEAAGRADPFEGRYLFYQAQSLRSQGKVQEAATRLRRALDRVEDTNLAENYQLALRLAQVELGEDAVFGEELARRLLEPNPAPDWLVIAAARECQAGRVREGAELLRRAFAQGGPAYAVTRLGDVFFRPFAPRPELAPLFAQYLPAPPAPPPLPPPPPPVVSPPATDLLSPPGAALVAPLPPTAPEAVPAAGKPTP